MSDGKLIELGLQGGGNVSALAIGFRTALDRLLALLRELVSMVDSLDPTDLLERIDQCRQSLHGNDDPRAIAAASGRCFDVCQTILAQLEAQQEEKRREIASLMQLVSRTVSTIEGEAGTFHETLRSSVGRFESLLTLDDPRRLRLQLAREVVEFRSRVAEREKSWSETLGVFTNRVRALEEELASTRREALLDPLTKIANRGSFERTCKEWTTTVRDPFILAIVDVDDFKQINDAHGHTTGDRALVTIAQAFARGVRADQDVVARLGGDEFAVLARNVTLPQAEARIQAIVETLGAATVDGFDSQPVALSVSCGVAEFSAGDTMASLIERADQALYEAKRLGKNRVVVRAKPTLREMRGQ